MLIDALFFVGFFLVRMMSEFDKKYICLGGKVELIQKCSNFHLGDTMYFLFTSNLHLLHSD